MKIKLYSSKGCLQCIMLKEFFKKHKIKYREVDVDEKEKSFKEMVKKSKQDRTPVVDIERKIIIGYDIEELKKVLKI